jgi:hypothetical protein
MRLANLELDVGAEEGHLPELDSAHIGRSTRVQSRTNEQEKSMHQGATR